MALRASAEPRPPGALLTQGSWNIYSLTPSSHWLWDVPEGLCFPEHACGHLHVGRSSGLQQPEKTTRLEAREYSNSKGEDIGSGAKCYNVERKFKFELDLT